MESLDKSVSWGSTITQYYVQDSSSDEDCEETKISDPKPTSPPPTARGAAEYLGRNAFHATIGAHRARRG